MEKTRRNKIINDALTIFGKDAQIDMIIEECAELIKALCKIKRKRGDPNEKMANLIDELADVNLMLKQADVIFGKEQDSRTNGF